MANYFQISPTLVFFYRVSFSPTAEISRLELKFEEGIGQESNGAANQGKQIFLLCQISPSASSTRDLGTRLEKRWDENLGMEDLGLLRKTEKEGSRSRKLWIGDLNYLQNFDSVGVEGV